MFCDLVGSTAFAERVDAEAARDVMGRYHHMVREVVEAHGGTVSKFIGDGVMALWGVPEVTEDDAARAVACGIEVQRRFVPIGAHVQQRHGARVGLRVGINTGELVIADEDDDIVGDALNTAARIEAACAPGFVLVGEDTWRLTRSAVRYEVLDEVRVKGKEEPVATFQVVEAGSGDDDAGPFVGRDAELGTLRAAYERAAVDRVAQLVTVIGSPGVGKTRLASELVRSVEGQATALGLRCEREGTATFAPIRDLLLGLTHVEIDGDNETKLAALDALFNRSVPDRERLVDLLGSFIGASEARSTEESFFAVRRVLELLGAERPVVVVVDDIQWAEPLLLDLLEHLAEWVEDGAVLVVGLARPEIRSVRPSLAEGGRRMAAVVPLEGLGPEATTELAARLLGVEELPAELVARLPESTEGNPLFVRELVRMLADDGVLARSGDSYVLTVDAEAVEVPPTIQSLLAARVERLPADERRLVELAAVVGTDFPRGALAALAPDLSRAGIDAVVEQLRRKELIDTTGTYWGNEPLLRFHHVLIRDAAYRRLLKGARAELHMAVARWTEESAGSATGEHDVTIALHLEQAYRYRTELGPPDDEARSIGAQAAALLREAAERALDSDDLAAAGSLARRALRLVEPGHRSQPALLLIACEALLSSGDLNAGREALDELWAIGDGGRLDAWADCFDAQLTVFTEPDRLSEVAEACRDAAVRLTDLGDQAGVAKARQVRAGALARLGRIGDCEVELDDALTAARAADDRRRVTAVLGVSPPAALWGPSPVPRAGGRCLDVVRLLRITAGSPGVEATSVRCQGVLEALRGRFDAARDLLASSQETAEELGLRQGLYETELYAGIVELMAGDPATAETHLRRAHAGLGNMGIGADAGQAAAHLAKALLLQQRAEEAEPLVAEAMATAGQNLQTAIAAHAVNAEILAEQGRHDEALREAEVAVATAAGTDIVVDHAQAVAALARVRALAGDTAGAAAAEREAALLYEAKGATQPGSDSGTSARSSDASATVGPEPLASPQVALYRRIEDLVPDVELMRPLLAPDMHRYDRRRIASAGDVDREGFLAGIAGLRDAGGAQWLSHRVLEVRGNRLLMLLAEIGYGVDSVSPVLMVLRWDDADLLDRMYSFDDDDVEAAVRQLDELEAELDSGAKHNRATRSFAVFAAWVAAGNAAGCGGQLAASCRRTDRRRGVSLPDAGRDELIASMQALFDVGGGADPFVDVEQLVGDSVAVVSGSWRYAGGEVSPMLLAVRVDEADLIDRMVVFDSDELAAAGAEAERLAGRASANQAAAVMVELIARHTHGEDWTPLVAESFERHDRRTNVVAAPVADRSSYLEHWAEFQSLGGKVSNPEVIATRSDHLALLRAQQTYGEEYVSPACMVCRADRAGLLDLMIIFDVDRLDEATAELDRLAGVEPVTASPDPRSQAENTASRAVQQLCETDFDDRDGWSRLLAENMVRIDRRAGFQFPTTRSREGFLDGLDEAARLGFRRLVCEPIAVRGDRHALVEIHFQTEDDQSVPFLNVTRLDDEGRQDLAVYYDLDALPDALAELDRQYLEGEGAPHVDVLRPVFEWIAALNRGDSEAHAAMVGDGFVMDDHRKAGLGVLRGQQYRSVLSGLADGDDTPCSVVTVLQEVTDSMVTLSHDRYRKSDELGSPAWRVSARFEVRDGRLIRCDVYEVGDLERASASGPAPTVAPENAHDHAASRRAFFETCFDRLTEEMVAAFETRHVQRVMPLFRRDVVRIDRREGFTMPPAGYDELVGVMRSLFDEDGGVRFRTETIEAIGRARLARTSFDRSTGFTTNFLVVNSLDDEGLVAIVDIYEDHQLDEARARLRELTGGAGNQLDRLELVAAAEDNLAVRTFLEQERLLEERDLDRVADLLADDFVRIDRRSNVGAPDAGPGEIRSAAEATLGVGMTFAPRKLITTRGPRLALMRVAFVDADERFTPFLAVSRVDQRGQFERNVYFDEEDLGSALDELAVSAREVDRPSSDADHQVAGADPHGSATDPESLRQNRCVAQWRAFEAEVGPDNLDVFEEMYAENYLRIDRRAVSAPPAGRAGQRAAVAALFETGMGSSDFSVLETRGDNLALFLGGFSSPSWDDVQFLMIMSVNEAGLFHRGVFFDVDKLEDARSELQRLHDESARVDAVWPGMHNQVLAAMNQLVGRMAPGGVATSFESMAEDYVRFDHRAGISMPPTDRDAQAAAMEAMYDVGIDLGQGRVIALRGDRHALVEARFVANAGSSADQEVPFLIVMRGTREGLIDRNVYFSLDDLPAALAELDRAYLEDGGEPPGDLTGFDNEIVRRGAELGRRLNAREDCGDLFADDYLRVDRRTPVSLPDADRAQQLEDVNREWYRVGANAQHSTPIALQGERHGLFRNEWSFEDGSQIQFLSVSEIDEEGRARRVTYFNTGDLASALDHLDELYLAGGHDDPEDLVSPTS